MEDQNQALGAFLQRKLRPISVELETADDFADLKALVRIFAPGFVSFVVSVFLFSFCST